LIPSTDSTHRSVSLRNRFSPGSEEQPVQLTLRDAVMAADGLDAPNFLFVNPLLNRRKADPQLQSCVTQFD
jgi:hypothetical protein